MNSMPRNILIKLLRRYAQPTFDRENMVATEHDAKGNVHMASVQGCCALAADVLVEEIIYTQKFKALVAGLKASGADHLYEHIMRQPIDKALL